MSTIQINFSVNPYGQSFLITSVLRSDTGLAPAGISLPITLVKGSLTDGFYPWTGSFTDVSPPSYYDALGTINGIATPPLTIPGTTQPGAGQLVPYTLRLLVQQYSTPTLPFPIVDTSGNPVNLSGKIIEFVAWTSDDGGETKSNLILHDNASIGGITITGAGNNVINVTLDQSDTRDLLDNGANYSLWDLNVASDTGLLLYQGVFQISPASQPELVS